MGWSRFSWTDFALPLNVLNTQTVSSLAAFMQSTLDKNLGRVNSSDYHLRFHASGLIQYSARHHELASHLQCRPTWHLPVPFNVYGLIEMCGNEPNASRTYETPFPDLGS